MPFGSLPQFFTAPVHLIDAQLQRYVALPKRLVNVTSKQGAYQQVTRYQLRRCDEFGRITPRVRFRSKKIMRVHRQLARLAAQVATISNPVA